MVCPRRTECSGPGGADVRQGSLDGGDVAAVDDFLSSVEDYHGHDLAAVALAPLPERVAVATDVAADIGDALSGEKPFHRIAVGSAFAHEDDH